MIVDNFWSDNDNLYGPPSEDLMGRLKVAGNLFFESSTPINHEQVNDILYTLIDYPDLRFIKMDTPNIKKSFSSTVEAENYLKQLVIR
jgi:hypothetical protein